VHPEPRHGGQPGLHITELARLHARLEDRLDPLLIGTAAFAKLLRSLAGERRNSCKEDPDVVRVAVDDVEQFLAQHGELPSGRATRLRHTVCAKHHLVHHPIVDGREQVLLGAM